MRSIIPNEVMKYADRLPLFRQAAHARSLF